MKLNYVVIAFLIGIALLTTAVSATAAFTATPTSGTAPLTVRFNDTSTGDPTSWNWSFGDGSGVNVTDPYQRNVSHVYGDADIFDVSLTVTNASGSNTTVKNNYITVTQPTPVPTTSTPVPTSTATPAPTQTQSIPPPVAAFSCTPTTGHLPLTNVVCTDQSTGNPTTWYWTWGDTTSSQETRTPSHDYMVAGVYSVSLTVTNAGGSNTMVKNNYLTISSSTVVPTPTPTISPGPGSSNQSLIVFRPGNGDWFFDNNKDGVVDQRIHFGTGGDEPHYFDWNGDGVKDLVVFRPSNGNWYVDTNMDGQVDVFLHFGTMGDISVIGT